MKDINFSNVKLKINKHGECEEFNIDGVPFGNGISKLEIIIEGGKPAKMILEMIHPKIELEGKFNKGEIKKQVKD